ncbi:MAG: helix-turn-helix domain-containing protein [Hungatella sp.]|jgi:transcriptional regulator with XRE-family HTH domain|nr:helix-turn-helix domain-containing protein [Hungatella sp.]
MERPKSEFDVLGTIEKERLSRGWSEYTLAKNSGITPSTISTWYRKNLQPSISSIEKICKGLDISLSQFFSSPEDQCINPTDSQKEILDVWKYLNESQKESTIMMLKSFIENRI